MKISRFDSHKDATPKPEAHTWETLAELLSRTHGTQKHGPAWSPASYPEGKNRAKSNVTEVCALVLDLDHLTDDQLVQVETDLARFEYLAHESFSSMLDDRCCRFVMKLSRPVLAAEWPRFWTQAIEELTVPADKATSDASRLYFLPARPVGRELSYSLEVHPGEVLDVDEVLSRAKVDEARVEAPRTSLEHGPIPQGQRDITLHRYAGAMRRSGLEVPEIAAALHVMNDNRCVPPLEAEEVERLAASAQRYAMEDDQQSHQEWVKFLDERVKVAKSDGYIVDLIEFYEKYDANKDDHDSWLIQGVLGKGVPQIMAGPPKARKSWVMYSMALAVASGRKWLEEFETERCKVLVMGQEDPAPEAHRRIFRLAKGAGIDPMDIRGWLSVNATDKFKFTEARYMDELRRGIEKWEPKLILIDSLSRVHSGDENSVQEMQAVTEIWSDICKQYGVAVVTIHHFGKSEGGSILNRMRGTSDLGAMARHVIGVTKLEVDDGGSHGHVSLVEVDGNLPGMTEPFSMGIRDGMVGDDKAVYIEYRSQARQEAYGQVKRDFLNFLTASEPEPQSKTQLLACTRERAVTVKMAVLNELLETGQIVVHGKKYRVADPVSG